MYVLLLADITYCNFRAMTRRVLDVGLGTTYGKIDELMFNKFLLFVRKLVDLVFQKSINIRELIKIISCDNHAKGFFRSAKHQNIDASIQQIALWQINGCLLHAIFHVIHPQFRLIGLPN